jgi:hypothetical protein
MSAYIQKNGQLTLLRKSVTAAECCFGDFSATENDRMKTLLGVNILHTGAIWIVLRRFGVVRQKNDVKQFYVYLTLTPP